MNFILFITVLLTAVTLVLGAYVIAKLTSSAVSPRAAAAGCLCMRATISLPSFS